MPKKKKRPAMPRVTVYSMNRDELKNFVAAVEALSILVGDLREIAAALAAARPGPDGRGGRGTVPLGSADDGRPGRPVSLGSAGEPPA